MIENPHTFMLFNLKSWLFHKNAIFVIANKQKKPTN